MEKALSFNKAFSIVFGNKLQTPNIKLPQNLSQKKGGSIPSERRYTKPCPLW